MQIYYKTKEVGGTTSANYPDMVNKPKLNGNELVSDITTEGADITWYGTQAEYDAITTKNSNTLYIVDDGDAVVTTSSYLDLNNKPSINGQILTGNKTSADLSMYTMNEVDRMLTSMRSVKVLATKPTNPSSNTLYYIGPDVEGYYHMYLYDSVGAEIDMGTTKQGIYSGANGVRIDVNNNILLANDAETVVINSAGEVEVPVMNGATSTATGAKGLVPAPSAGDQAKVLMGDGTWTSNYLPLTGGTMTGTIRSVGITGTGDYLRNVDTSSYVRVCGSSSYNTGAYLLLTGQDMTNYTGKFELAAYNGTTRKVISGAADGSLTWNGNDISGNVNGIDSSFSRQSITGTTGYAFYQIGKVVHIILDGVTVSSTSSGAQIMFKTTTKLPIRSTCSTIWDYTNSKPLLLQIGTGGSINIFNATADGQLFGELIYILA